MGKEPNPENQTAAIRTGKFERILDSLRRGISDGRYAAGVRLPTELELTRQFEVSRPTAARALNELERIGLVERIAGSGTYVKQSAQRASKLSGKVFGLLIPGLGSTEIFEPICGRMAAWAEAVHCTLLWGGCEQEASGGESVRQLALRYIQQHVDGVFFAPPEFIPDKQELNSRILTAFDEAQIPVVLLDRDAVPFPLRTAHDLVGLDNVQAAFNLTSHLISQGCTRIHFLARPFAAPTLEERLSGYWSALIQAGITPDATMVHQTEPGDAEFVKELLRSGADAVICSNDANAIELTGALEKQGVLPPQEIKIAGFDDVAYAKHVKIPLTTIRQPCIDIGMAAFDAMTSRLAEPRLPPRTIRLSGKLMIRQSTSG